MDKNNKLMAKLETMMLKAIEEREKKVGRVFEENGFGEKYFWVHTQPKNRNSVIWLSNIAEELWFKIGEKYREKVVGFVNKDDGFFFTPVFDEETQKMWDKEEEEYIARLKQKTKIKI